MHNKQPLFVTVSARILEDIRAGKFQEVLPTEQELASAYGVSRPTIRSALQRLNDENIVTTLHGRGTFITGDARSSCLRIDKFKGFYQLFSDAGYKVKIEEVGQEFISTFNIAHELPSEFFSNRLLLIKRILLCSGAPSVYLEEYIPENFLATHEFVDLPDSIYGIVEKLTNHKIKYTISKFLPVLPPENIAEIFSVPHHTPVFMVNEMHFNMLNQVMIFSRVYISSNNNIAFAVIRTR